MQRARIGRFWMMGSLLLLPALVGAVPGPVGSEFQVNTYTTAAQLAPAVAGDASGNFVVVWDSCPGYGGSGGQDGDSCGVFGQRFNSSGTPQGSEFQVNTYTTDGQFAPAVAADAAGNFVVVWTSYQDSSAPGVFGQRFDSSGTLQGPEFQVNTYTTGDHKFPAVAADAAGNFMVVWESYGQDGDVFGVFGQRFDSSGTPQGSEFQVNTYTTGHQFNPAVATDAAGNFMVLWTRSDRNGFDREISGQRYDSSGAPQGGEFQVNTYTMGDQDQSAVAADAAGNFVVVWGSFSQNHAGLFSQRFDSSGTPQGSEFQVNTDGTLPAVATDGSGNFVVVWTGSDGSDLGTFAKRFDSSGIPQGSAFQVNTYTPGMQVGRAVAADATGNFVVVWHSGQYLSTSGQDGNTFGVFGQRYDSNGLPSPGRVPISSTRLALTDKGATRRSIMLRSGDPSVANGINPVINPVANGAFLHIFNNAGSGDSACFSLPPTGWVGLDPDRAVYRYSDPTFANGPCDQVIIKRGKLLRASCRSSVQPIAYSLDETMQGSVGVNLTIGPATYCALFGGTIVADSGTTGQFRAKKATAPASCPTPPASCP